MPARHFNIADLFEIVADTVPEREALVCGEARRTYAELEQRANRLAHFLAAQGIGAGDKVGLYLHNCNEYLEGMLACFKVRAVPVNVNFRYVDEELSYILNNADMAGCIHHREFVPHIAAVRAASPTPEDADRGGRRHGLRSGDDRRDRLRTGAGAGLAGARLRRALRRRYLPALHRRHHRHAQGRDVAAQGGVLRRDGRRRALPPRRRDRGARGHRGAREGRLRGDRHGAGAADARCVLVVRLHPAAGRRQGGAEPAPFAERRTGAGTSWRASA